MARRGPPAEQVVFARQTFIQAKDQSVVFGATFAATRQDRLASLKRAVAGDREHLTSSSNSLSALELALPAKRTFAGRAAKSALCRILFHRRRSRVDKPS